MLGVVVLTTMFHESVQTLSSFNLKKKVLFFFFFMSHIKLLSVARPAFPENQGGSFPNQITQSNCGQNQLLAGQERMSALVIPCQCLCRAPHMTVPEA